MNSKNPEENRNYIYHMIRDIREVNGFQLKPEHNAVLVFIESRGKKAYPSHETLSADCGMKVTKTKKVLSELKHHGLLDWTSRQGKPNRYKINRKNLQNAYLEAKEKEVNEEILEWEEFHPDWDI